MKDLAGKRVVITGGTSGIDAATAQRAQAAGQSMLDGAGGVILNAASTNALLGYRRYAHCNATKAGPVSLTQSLALEWAPKGRVM
jgi:NAD(P)-dependent dehydrogenase (short-subunit alcohol dehydrogenase family)